MITNETGADIYEIVPSKAYTDEDLNYNYIDFWYTVNRRFIKLNKTKYWRYGAIEIKTSIVFSYEKNLK